MCSRTAACTAACAATDSSPQKSVTQPREAVDTALMYL